MIIDTDDVVRWVSPVGGDSTSTAFHNNGRDWIAGLTTFSRIELDGTAAHTALTDSDCTKFHHDITSGKTGLLVEVDGTEAGVQHIESMLAEVDAAGATIREWDLAEILSDNMRSRGDDPSTFVGSSVDWFHMNAAVYDPTDDSVIVSSRENFVIKLDYQSGNII